MATPLSEERIAEMREFWDGHEDGDTSDDRAVWRFVHHASLDLLDEVERLRALVRDLNAALVAKQQEGDSLAGHYVAIRAENQSLRDHHYSLDACPECGRLPPDHALDCALDAALRGADE